MPALEPTHDEWQAQVWQLAVALGWKVLHVRKALGRRQGGRAWQTTTNVRGWPDLFLWHPAQRRWAAIECKTGRGVASPEQLEVLAELEATGAAVMVAWPRHLEQVRDLLSRQPG